MGFGSRAHKEVIQGDTPVIHFSPLSFDMWRPDVQTFVKQTLIRKKRPRVSVLEIPGAASL